MVFQEFGQIAVEIKIKLHNVLAISLRKTRHCAKQNTKISWKNNIVRKVKCSFAI